MDLTHYTLLLFQSLSEPEYMTARPAEDLSTAGNKCPPESCPAQTPGRRCLSLWPAFHPSLLLVTCASMPVIESLLPLRSLQPDLTPSAIYKDLLSKGELEMRHCPATDPTAASSYAHKDGDGGEGEGQFQGEGDLTL